MGHAFPSAMLRRFLFSLLLALLLTALPKSASAQSYFNSFGAGGLAYYPAQQVDTYHFVPLFHRHRYVISTVQGGYTYTFTPQPPRARHDNRIDPHLLLAARIADANAFAHSTMRCWRYVKQALLQAGAVAQYPGTDYACQAGTELTSRYGFVRLSINDPYNAPVGSVLVYSGGGAGHVEIRTEHGFASDYRSAWACRYRLIGVYAKLS